MRSVAKQTLSLDKDQIKQWFSSLKPDTGSVAFNPRKMLSAIGINTSKDAMNYLQSPESAEYKALKTLITRNEAIERLLLSESLKEQQEQEALNHSILAWFLRRFFARHEQDNQKTNAAYQQHIDKRLAQLSRQNAADFSSAKVHNDIQLLQATYDISEEAAENILDATLAEIMLLEQELQQIHLELLEIDNQYTAQNNELNRLDALYSSTSPSDQTALGRIMQRLAQLTPMTSGMPLTGENLEYRYLNDRLHQSTNDHQMYSKDAQNVNDYSNAALLVPRKWTYLKYKDKEYLFKTNQIPENLHAVPQAQLESAHNLYQEKSPSFMTARYFIQQINAQARKVVEDRKAASEQRIQPLLAKWTTDYNRLQQVQAAKIDAEDRIFPAHSKSTTVSFVSSYEKMFKQLTQAPQLKPGNGRVLKPRLDSQEPFLPAGSTEDMRRVMQGLLKIGFIKNAPLGRGPITVPISSINSSFS